MSDKRRLWVAVFHRGPYSMGADRERLGLAALHWAIVITPKVSRGEVFTVYDVADTIKPAQQINIDPSRNREYQFRVKGLVDLRMDVNLVRLFMIGKLPKQVLSSRTTAILASVPVPVCDAVPKQNGVTWVKAAIRALQDADLAERFDIEDFMSVAARSGFRVIDEKEPPLADLYQNYTGRRM